MKPSETILSIELVWQGPFSWPGACYDAHTPDLGDSEFVDSCGVYLWTVNYGTGFLIYAAGITNRPFRVRFREHTRAYRSGVYTIFDAPSLIQGQREVLWPGFWFGHRSVNAERDYAECESEIRVATEKLLGTYRVFVAPIQASSRVLRRIEAAIMNALYSAGGVVGQIPDRGMALAPRWDCEDPISVRNSCEQLIHGLPAQLDV